jgi:FKBP-type peptidyl-prolyl cis-trans isomerase SlpA
VADNNDDIQIEPGSLVSLHFSLALTDGHVIDSNFAAPAAKFRLGDGNMLPGFEAVLIGLKPGQELETILEPEHAFGVVNPRNQHRFPVAKFKNLLEDELISTEVGAVVSFKDAAGFSLPGVIAEISDQTIAVDFNHPLAGKRIVFKANIVAVLPADVAGVEVKP